MRKIEIKTIINFKLCEGRRVIHKSVIIRLFVDVMTARVTDASEGFILKTAWNKSVEEFKE